MNKVNTIRVCIILMICCLCTYTIANDTLKYCVSENEGHIIEIEGDAGSSYTHHDYVTTLTLTVEVVEKTDNEIIVRVTIIEGYRWLNGRTIVPQKELDGIEYTLTIGNDGKVSEENDEENETTEIIRIKTLFCDQVKRACLLLFGPREGRINERQYRMMANQCEKEYGDGYERYWSTDLKKVIRADKRETMEHVRRDVRFTEERRTIITADEKDLRRYVRENQEKAQAQDDAQE